MHCSEYGLETLLGLFCAPIMIGFPGNSCTLVRPLVCCPHFCCGVYLLHITEIKTSFSSRRSC